MITKDKQAQVSSNCCDSIKKKKNSNSHRIQNGTKTSKKFKYQVKVIHAKSQTQCDYVKANKQFRYAKY